MDKDKYQHPNRIRAELMHRYRWVNEKRDIATMARLVPITDDLAYLIAELSVEREQPNSVHT